MEGALIMELTEIPFPKLIGILRDISGRLSLQMADTVQNHLGTMHAGAQFTLAETASADCLQQLFPCLKESVVTVLRASQMKYRNAATTGIYAIAFVSEDARETFLKQFERKGRGSVCVEVEVRDIDENITCQGTYEWYAQKLEGTSKN
jgi:acyl-coenzyme A thioesterase PaaI-like protein